MIVQANEQHINLLNGLLEKAGYKLKQNNYFQDCFEKKDRDIFIVYDNEMPCGYGFLNYEPRYSLYKKLNIPEIQDIHILETHRNKGLATELIKNLEHIALSKGYKHIGISVALHKQAAAAQRLYTKLGYVPDGYGVTYDREPIDPAKHYPFDDNLCLMLIKELEG